MSLDHLVSSGTTRITIMIKIKPLHSLFFCGFLISAPLVHAISYTEVIVTERLYGSARVTSGGDFDLNIERSCREYTQAKHCESCSDLEKMDIVYLGKQCEEVDKKIHVQLTGLIVPEADETCETTAKATFECGAQAKAALEDLVAEKEINCINEPINTFVEEEVLTFELACFADKKDLSQSIAESGWGKTHVKSDLVLINLERDAKKAKLGLWQ